MWQPESLDVQLCWTIKWDKEMRDRVWLKAYALEGCRQSSRKWKEWSQKYTRLSWPTFRIAIEGFELNLAKHNRNKWYVNGVVTKHIIGNGDVLIEFKKKMAVLK
jgi:hypothetical protein